MGNHVHETRILEGIVLRQLPGFPLLELKTLIYIEFIFCLKLFWMLYDRFSDRRILDAVYYLMI